MNYATSRTTHNPAAISDALWKSYRWMSIGLAVTGVVALLVASSQAAIDMLLMNRGAFLFLVLAQLGLVFAFSAAATRVSTVAAASMFLIYAALSGVTFSTIFLVYTATSIAKVFFITGGAFAGLSMYGAVTRSDLSGIGRFAIFALIGLIIASFVNLFFHSTGLEWGLSFIGVAIFGALTAYDTQKLKELFASGQVHANMPLVGALTLYLDFVNMFIFLLRLFGNRRND
jgi:FtsH-binding integral membrane protein